MSASVQTIQTAGIETKCFGLTAASGQGDNTSEGSFIGILTQIVGSSFSRENVAAGVKAGLISTAGVLTEKGTQALSAFDALMLKKLAAGEEISADAMAAQSVLSNISAGLAALTPDPPCDSDSTLLDPSLPDNAAAGATAAILSLLPEIQKMKLETVSVPEGSVSADLTDAGVLLPTTAQQQNITQSATDEVAVTGDTLPETTKAFGTAKIDLVEKVVEEMASQVRQAEEMVMRTEMPDSSMSDEIATSASVSRSDQTASQRSPREVAVPASSSGEAIASSSSLASELSKVATTDATQRQAMENIARAAQAADAISLRADGGDRAAQYSNVAATGLALSGAAARAGVKIETVEQQNTKDAAVTDSAEASMPETTDVPKQTDIPAGLDVNKKVSAGDTTDTAERSFRDVMASAASKEETPLVKGDGTHAARYSDQAGNAAAISSANLKNNEHTGITPQTVIRQVVEGVSSTMTKDSGRIRIELTPPSLGTLNMDLVVTQDRVKMVILADSQDTSNLLQSNMDQLKNSLQQQGLKIDGIDVSVQDRFLNQSNHHSGENWGGQHAWHYHGQNQDGTNRDNESDAINQGVEGDELLNRTWRANSSGVHIVA